MGDGPGETPGTRGDREREAAERQRARADVEHDAAEQHDSNEPLHRRAEQMHLEAAELHENAARLFDAHDDPDVSEDEARAVADDVISDQARKPLTPPE
jgi:hypothetical protein